MKLTLSCIALMGLFCLTFGKINDVAGPASPNKPKIIGGSTALPKRFKYMALLKRSGSFVCGGSLITRRHVLTAKHCVGNYAANKFQVVLGEYRRSKFDGTEQYRNVKSICKHPSYDAAVLLLSHSVVINSTVQTIPLATSLPPVGYQTTASGWGWTIHGVSSAADYLQYITLPRASTAACNSEGLNVKPHELCIGKSSIKYMNVCHGDSGSPLVYPKYSSSTSYKPKQIGIVERGHGSCPKKYKYAVFVSVPSIYDWIMGSCSVAHYLPNSYWTAWIDRDDPSGTGDWETRSSMTPKPCGTKTPIAYEYDYVNKAACVKRNPLAECASNQVLAKSRSYGLRCENNKQKTIKKKKGWWFTSRTKYYKCKCCDYKIRFRCPY